MNAAGAPQSRHAIDGAALNELRTVLGHRLHLGEAIRVQHGTSEAHFPVAAPDAVAFPRSADEVIALVDICRTHRLPVVPYGAGTSLEGQTAAVRGGLCLDFSEMNAILRIGAEDMDCTVQPGVTREQLNHSLRDLGLFFPIDPGANATLGGMVSTRASGTNAVRYGTMRDAVLSLRVVTSDGRQIRTGQRARKSSAGYDLTRLFVGAEGTLGIITEITLRLYGIPHAISSATCSFDTLRGAVDTTIVAIQTGIPLARIELLDEVQVNAVNRYSGMALDEKPALFLEFHGTQQGVAEQVELVREIAAHHGGGGFRFSNLPEERSRLWKARHTAYPAGIALRPGALGWATDVCVPISRLADCILETKADLAHAPFPAPIVGHVGDGNFHVLFVLDPSRPEEQAHAEHLNERLVRRALEMGGTCTGEHGVGLGKQRWLREELGEAVDLMDRIKRTIDPDRLFNPGKIFES